MPGQPRVLVVTKGHPFEREPFFTMWDELGIDWTHVEQPAALALFDPDHARPFDAFVLYDMPGIRFQRGQAPTFEPPPVRFVTDLHALLEQGKPMLVLHHAAAAWPAWEGWAELVGARFHYQPGVLDGREWPDSGYRMDVKHRIRAVADHPVTAGAAELAPDGFELEDELYLWPVLEDSVTPLFRSDADFRAAAYQAAGEAIGAPSTAPGEWTHPDGSDLVGWVKTAGRSPLVYLQFGHGPATWVDPVFRRVVGDAITWLTSDPARAWADS
ncbi:MAG: ThuA domain-containing protein [Actinomycetota bacterium]